jgi:hypothetical protein
MSDEMNAEILDEVEAIKKSELLADAVVHIKELEALWPLTDPGQIDNDVKYGEEFQVRVTCQIANRLSDEEVTLPDAEYYYDAGVDTIAGRPQEVTEALAQATDAYEIFLSAGENRDFSQIDGVFGIFGIQSNQSGSANDEYTLAGMINRSISASEELDSGSTIENSLALICSTIHLITSLYGKQAGLLVPLMLCTMSEVFGLPQIYLSDDFLSRIADVQSNANSQELALARFSQSIVDEVDRHKSDVEWDLVEAKKAAQEADEAKNKAALNEKFKDAPNTDDQKEHIEL